MLTTSDLATPEALDLLVSSCQADLKLILAWVPGAAKLGLNVLKLEEQTKSFDETMEYRKTTVKAL